MAQPERITPSQLRLYLLVCQHWRDRGRAPSTTWLAEQYGCSRENAWVLLLRLVAGGLLSRGSAGQWKTWTPCYAPERV